MPGHASTRRHKRTSGFTSSSSASGSRARAATASCCRPCRCCCCLLPNMLLQPAGADRVQCTSGGWVGRRQAGESRGGRSAFHAAQTPLLRVPPVMCATEAMLGPGRPQAPERATAQSRAGCRLPAAAATALLRPTRGRRSAGCAAAVACIAAPCAGGPPLRANNPAGFADNGCRRRWGCSGVREHEDGPC